MTGTRTLLTGGTVFDSRSATGSQADVVFDDDGVIEVGTGLDGDVAIDVTGKLVIPGLFDCHVHIGFSHLDTGRTLYEPASLKYYEAVANLRTLLSIGLTTVRDAGYCDAGAKVALERGLIEGPRLKIAVNMLTQTGGHSDPWLPSGVHWPADPGIPQTSVDGLDSARRAVREMVRSGADHIKIAVSGGGLSAHTDPNLRHFRDDELNEIVVEARAAGRDVMAHVHAKAGAIAAARAGVRSLEHGTNLDDEAVSAMVENGTFLVPTLVAPYGVLEAAEAGVSLPTGSEHKARELIAIHAASFKRALDAGVPIAMGTDTPVLPHGRNLEELQRMVDAGMTAAQAWQAATWTAARLMRLDQDSGSLEPGKRADIAVFDGSVDDVRDLAGRVEQVWLAGRRAR